MLDEIYQILNVKSTLVFLARCKIISQYFKGFKYLKFDSNLNLDHDYVWDNSHLFCKILVLLEPFLPSMTSIQFRTLGS